MSNSCDLKTEKSSDLGLSSPSTLSREGFPEQAYDEEAGEVVPKESE